MILMLLKEQQITLQTTLLSFQLLNALYQDLYVLRFKCVVNEEKERKLIWKIGKKDVYLYFNLRM